MTDLRRLKVSLTKHNAHKVAWLLKAFSTNQILDKLGDVHAERAQAFKNLSVLPGLVVPPVWEKARNLGGDAIDALVLLAIIFSHHQLIGAMVNASSRSGFSGRIERENQLGDKAYTNFSRIVDRLGYATQVNYSGVSFNLKPMFEIAGLGPLVAELLALKLDEAGWNRANTVEAECQALGLHEVFGVAGEEFQAWLARNEQPPAATTQLPAKDEEFFKAEGEGVVTDAFEFRAGHVDRSVEPIDVAPSGRTKATQLHNDLQNRLYVHLCARFGVTNVGTEVDTGYGTTIDVITRRDDEITFYEIKTSTSVRTSLRQAIPQLLEYSLAAEQASK